MSKKPTLIETIESEIKWLKCELKHDLPHVERTHLELLLENRESRLNEIKTMTNQGV